MSVLLLSDPDSGVRPYRIRWHRDGEAVERVHHHERYRRGRTIYHAWVVRTATLTLRLVLDTETMTWTVDAIDDGVPT